MPNVYEVADAAAGASTAYTLSVGTTAQGTIGVNGDHDWWRVNLVAGQTYSIAMVGTGSNNVVDPILNLYGPSGTTLVAYNDDGLQNHNAIITYTPVVSGSYYIDASHWTGANEAGRQYGLSVTTGTRALFDTDMAAGVIDTDSAWNSTPGTAATVSYGYRSTYSGTESNFAQLTAAQMAAVDAILPLFSEVANISFTNAAPGGYTNNATMLFSSYQANDGAGAYAYYPGSTAATANAGDVWLNRNSVSTSSLPVGGYSHFATMHEIGHAVGLSHPGVYNAGVGVSITYANNAQFTQDSHQYSVMSYFDESSTGANYGSSSYPDTLMIHDVLALQRIYGANTATRTGNTVYGYNSNAGGAFDFTTNTNPAICIWDAGGTDTLDMSGYSGTQVISLVNGTFSSVRGYTSNLSIAFGATIENAIGGAGNDTIVANNSVNVVNGGGGTNTISYEWSAGRVVVNLATQTVSGGDAQGDTISNFQSATGGSGNDDITGTSGANVLSGNAGTDYIYGGDGNDTIYGGAGIDILYGQSGTDIMYGGSETDYILSGAGTGNVLYGEGGVDVLYSEGTSDILVGGDGSDYFYDLTGSVSPTSYGGEGNDILADISASGAHDIFYGENGQDYCYGYGGNDLFYGGAGVDVFLGGNGNDIFDGGTGVDYGWGGSGNDTYIVRASSGVLVVNDFEAGAASGDILMFSAAGISSYSQAVGAMTYYGGMNTTILTVDADTSIWFINQHPSYFAANDFLFT